MARVDIQIFFTLFFCLGSEFQIFYLSIQQKNVCEFRRKVEIIFRPIFLILIHIWELHSSCGGRRRSAPKKGFISKLNLAYVSNKLRIQGILSPILFHIACSLHGAIFHLFYMIFSCLLSRVLRTFFLCVGISGERSDTFSFLLNIGT